MNYRNKPLTARELTCLQWASTGKTSWETGVILGLTERTVNFHIHNACRKLGVHSRQAAITMALTAGLVPGISAPGLSRAETPVPAPPENPGYQP
ncbi:helix-turn-helix transcriptional regulator [Allopusillimonas soli]|uniref:Helix-turn-helix domain-containing protein n=1 Tax=Allopusillimonas soli TaxID=659016 RepID=A0A853F6M3_9BURK|nr:helix-turn-helix domain-containing protein [Allopusillimonas soli]NYT36225.1 helix-turn-helix domain-containing protein [Allopusillimonas soli]TEA76553.1 helix-turn-helix transcriptional regulator [Allopusillimonas soli]